ncbi:MAG TPA: DAK2 domain-containing protein [Actinomycetota bacterium]|nr:DAK2 domain-containing protein [Actinomycetota bacterium]
MPEALSARTLRRAMSRYVEALREHREEIDSLNVFPVPDGDTGTNMLLTQQAVDRAVEGLEEADMSELGEAISRAALTGARGNSGVILSQVLRGLCARLCRTDAPGATDLVEALGEASEEARRAVARPVEGTMLSVMRDAAEAARRAGGDGPGPADVADAALEGALRSLERTPEQLPELRRAGVVDAGGKGLVLLFDALVSALRDVPLGVQVGRRGPVGQAAAEPERPRDRRYGYEVMYLLEGDDGAVPGLRRALEEIGDSLVVVGGGGLYNIHVHTDEAGAAVERGIDAGRPRDIRITSLDEQVEACLADEARAVRAGEREPEGHGPAERQRTALVATAPGEGVARLLRSLGAVVVSGGPGRNPSVGELAEAIAGAPSDDVVVLPNHRNIVPAAERAAGEAAKRVAVVPTRSVAEGLAAAAAFDAEAAAEDNERQAREAADAVVAAEVAAAVRDAETPAGPVREGQFLGVVDGDVRAVGDDPVAVAVETVRPLVRDEHELLTLLVGEGVSEGDGRRAAEALGAAHRGLEVEVHRGDQPHYPFLIGLE